MTDRELYGLLVELEHERDRYLTALEEIAGKKRGPAAALAREALAGRRAPTMTAEMMKVRQRYIFGERKDTE